MTNRVCLGTLTDPSTFEGAIAVGVIVGVVLLALAGVTTKRLRPRRRRARWVPLEPAIVPPEIADLATGIGQAIMAVRDAIDHFDRHGVLVEPDTGALASGGELLVEARRVVDEAEARLPRVQLLVGGEASNAATDAVAELRGALRRLRDYIRQPDGDEWSYAQLVDAKAALEKKGSEHQAKFLASVGAR